MQKFKSTILETPIDYTSSVDFASSTYSSLLLFIAVISVLGLLQDQGLK